MPSRRRCTGLLTVTLDNVAAVDPSGRNVVAAHNNSGTTRRFVVAWRRWRFAYANRPRRGDVDLALTATRRRPHCTAFLG